MENGRVCSRDSQMISKQERYRREYRRAVRISNGNELNLSKFPGKCMVHGYEILDKNYELIEDFICCLSRWSGVPNAKVYLHYKPRLTTRSDREVHAEYQPSSQGKTAEVHIWMLTQMEKLVGPEEMLRTVIEEWMHHWDMKVLKLRISPHCKGFRHRVNQIMRLFELRP